MGKSIGTCGHEIKDGITVSIRSMTRDCRPCLDYGTYCADCILQHHVYGTLVNKELTELIKKVQDGTLDKYKNSRDAEKCL